MRVIQPDDDQKLADNKFRENTIIQTPTSEDCFPEKKRGRSVSLKEINHAHFGIESKFAVYTVYGNLICVLPTSLEK